ncbi:MAG: Gfo/Idh/MocA family oxidoreductase [Peptostreptococcus porci]|nr:Gfo/Idh/MocA family oxidoreductase [Peptostreptococcus porci]
MNKSAYRWGVIGCGTIANEFAVAMQKCGNNIYGVYSRTSGNAKKFAEKYNIDRVYNNEMEMLNDEKIEVVYISTPHNKHIEYIKNALKNGKHVLCEKAITLNSNELSEAIEIAKSKNLILAEAMTIYHMPLYQKLEELINTGNLGELSLIQANFGSFKEYDMKNRFFSMDTAGGALLDIGVYALSLTRNFMDFSNIEMKSFVKKAESGVDENASIILKNDKDELANITISLHSKQPKRVLIVFEKGYIEIYDYPRSDKATITYTEDSSIEKIELGNSEYALKYEIENMEMSIKNSKNMMKLDHTFDVMKVMTDLRKEWELYYPEEQ